MFVSKCICRMNKLFAHDGVVSASKVFINLIINKKCIRLKQNRSACLMYKIREIYLGNIFIEEITPLNMDQAIFWYQTTKNVSPTYSCVSHGVSY